MPVAVMSPSTQGRRRKMIIVLARHGRGLRSITRNRCPGRNGFAIRSGDIFTGGASDDKHA